MPCCVVPCGGPRARYPRAGQPPTHAPGAPGARPVRTLCSCCAGIRTTTPPNDHVHTRMIACAHPYRPHTHATANILCGNRRDSLLSSPGDAPFSSYSLFAYPPPLLPCSCEHPDPKACAHPTHTSVRRTVLASAIETRTARWHAASPSHHASDAEASEPEVGQQRGHSQRDHRPVGPKDEEVAHDRRGALLGRHRGLQLRLQQPRG